MRIREGKIGRQESAAMVGLGVYSSMVFTMSSGKAYSCGNGTCIWMPAAIALALGIGLFIMYAMESCGVSTLDALLKGAFGGLMGGIAGGAIIALLTVSAFELLADFVNLIHSLAFYDQPYWNIILWIVATVGLIAYLGLECISRTGRLLLPAFGIMLAVWLLLPVKSFRWSSLYPFPGNSIAQMGRLLLENTSGAFAPIIAVLTITGGMHGMRFARNSCSVGAICALLAVAATQLCLGLAYGYKDLADMAYPLYRLNMMMLQEGYFFRMDKLILFFWLAMGIIPAGYYVFTASIMWCRCYGSKDTRPVVLALCVLLACAMQIQAEGYYEEFAQTMNMLDSWAWVAILLPVAASVSLLIKKRLHREAGA